MGDIFSSELSTASGDSGSAPSGGAGETPSQPDLTATQTPAQPSDQATADRGQAGEGTEQVSTGAPAEAQPAGLSAEDVAKLEQEAEAALNDERTPKWFKHAVSSVYKPKIETISKQLETYAPFGTPEDIQKAVSLREALHEIRSDPSTGMPVPSTENFVKSLYEENPATAYQLIADLATLPSPATEGLTVTQELLKQMGIDPQRIPDIQKFAQNGYSLTASSYPAPDSEDLAQIPPHLQATFAKLDPETRSSLMADEQRVRDNNLEAHRIRMEHEESNATLEQRQAQEQQAREQQTQATFKADVDTKGTENFVQSSEAVLNSFVDSLATQAGFSKMDQMMVVNTVLNSLDQSTLEGRLSAEALKAEGIEVDPQIPQLIAKLNELSRHAAYYQLVNEQGSLSAVAADISSIQEKLTAKGNKIVAALAAKRNAGAVAPAVEQGQRLNVAQTSRHAIAGVGASQLSANGNQRMDFSEDAYLADLEREGFGRRSN